ncbi:DMT family transporter [Celerinatantimonas yamalensis]|uniref:DMT family transporter n=1 Tax=Celerinatantimonas yamalensis TaxID=559956 RepID=A0ABW9G9T7_9GAMM
MKQQSQAYLYGISAVLMWSTVATAFKLALRYLTPLQLMAIASLSSSVILTIILLLQGKLHLTKRYLRQHFRFYLLLGLINPFCYYLILFKAYELLPAQQAQPLNYTWAITLSLLAVPLLGHKLHRFDFAAMLLGYLGVVVIATQGNLLQLHFTSLPGVALALLSTLFWAGYWILNQRRKDDPIAGLLCSFILSLPITCIAMFVNEGFPTLHWQGLLGGIYVGCFEMGVTFACWVLALKKTEKTARISNLIFISPFLSLYLIAKFLGETIHPSTYFGLVLIIVGLLLQQYGNYWQIHRQHTSID